MIHGIGNHVVRRMQSFTRLNGLRYWLKPTGGN